MRTALFARLDRNAHKNIKVLVREISRREAQLPTILQYRLIMSTDHLHVLSFSTFTTILYDRNDDMKSNFLHMFYMISCLVIHLVKETIYRNLVTQSESIVII